MFLLPLGPASLVTAPVMIIRALTANMQKLLWAGIALCVVGSYASPIAKDPEENHSLSLGIGLLQWHSFTRGSTSRGECVRRSNT